MVPSVWVAARDSLSQTGDTLRNVESGVGCPDAVLSWVIVRETAERRVQQSGRELV